MTPAIKFPEAMLRHMPFRKDDQKNNTIHQPFLFLLVTNRIIRAHIGSRQRENKQSRMNSQAHAGLQHCVNPDRIPDRFPFRVQPMPPFENAPPKKSSGRERIQDETGRYVRLMEKDGVDQLIAFPLDGNQHISKYDVSLRSASKARDLA